MASLKNLNPRTSQLALMILVLGIKKKDFQPDTLKWLAFSSLWVAVKVSYIFYFI
jgi:hypothetical protein